MAKKDDFDEIIGYDYVKVELARILDVIKNPDKYLKLGVKMPRGLLLHGEPGTGKTLIAEAFIKASGWHSYVCRKKADSDNFLKTLVNTFKKAIEHQPAIILLDDLDKFANDDEHHQNSNEFIAIQTLIDETANDQIFVLTTANSIKNFPSSLTRTGRIDKVIHIKNPKGAEAEAIIKYYLSKTSMVGDVNIKLISRILSTYTCSDLKNVINEAGIYAGSQNKAKIDTDDIVRACMRVLFEAPESLTEESLFNIERTAYHEAGHAVVSEILSPKSVCLVSIKTHEGSIGGITLTDSGNEYMYTATEVDNKITVNMAGKAATELKYHEVDLGAADDLKCSADYTSRLVGTSAVKGLDKFSLEKYRPSQHNKYITEKAIYGKLKKAYRRARKILIKHRKFLNALSAALLEKLTLTYDEIQAIKATTVR